MRLAKPGQLSALSEALFYNAQPSRGAYTLYKIVAIEPAYYAARFMLDESVPARGSGAAPKRLQNSRQKCTAEPVAAFAVRLVSNMARADWVKGSVPGSEVALAAGESDRRQTISLRCMGFVTKNRPGSLQWTSYGVIVMHLPIRLTLFLTQRVFVFASVHVYKSLCLSKPSTSERLDKRRTPLHSKKPCSKRVFLLTRPNGQLVVVVPPT